MKTLTHLPGPLKVGMMLLTGGGVLAMIRYIVPDQMTFFFLLAGMMGVGSLFVIFGLVRRVLAKKSARKAEGATVRALGDAPKGVSDPKALARLDEMRTNFEDGIRKFREAGKNVYELPWYIVVGEPGSGKTTAIKNSGVGFPRGLENEMPGVGGTLNMNWWFTNQAVVLDTAGRIFFPEQGDGTVPEWREFLRLLRRHRQRCPINGLLLCIPADSLIRDSAETIKEKAQRIASQFDLITRMLNVRFPVYVIVTKADLIPGFREFTENVNEPHLQSQIFGMSNAADLDASFDTEQFCGDFQKVLGGRLRKRRGALILNPSHTSDPKGGRRMDEVDDLFAFPNAVEELVPRLRNYMDCIFAVNEVWSSKPVFVRGIYFTSGLRKGTPLDSALAEMAGLSVKELDDLLSGVDGAAEEKRSFFLTDLFRKKIFPEKGLVTAATNTLRQYRVKMAVLGTACALALGALAFTVWGGARRLDESIGRELSYWQKAVDPQGETPPFLDEGPPYQWPVVAKPSPEAGRHALEYVGHSPLPGHPLARLADLHASLAEATEKPLAVPFLFRLARAMPSQLAARRGTAQRTFFEASVIRPVADAAILRWGRAEAGMLADPEAAETLALLIRLETAARLPLAQNPGEDGEDGPKPFLDTGDLARLLDWAKPTLAENAALGKAEGMLPAFKKDFAPALDRFHADGGFQGLQAASRWPRIQDGVRAVARYWRSAEAFPQVRRLQTLMGDADAFNHAEAELLALLDGSAQAGRTQWGDELSGQWRERLELLAVAFKTVDGSAGHLGEKGFADAVEEAKNEFVAGGAARLDILIEALRWRPAPPPTEGENPQQEGDAAQETEKPEWELALQREAEQLEALKGDLPVLFDSWLPPDLVAKLDKEVLALVPAAEGDALERLCKVRTQAYQLADALRQEPLPPHPPSAELADAVGALRQRLDRDLAELARRFGPADHAPNAKEAASLTARVLRLETKRRTFRLCERAVENLPHAARIGELVAEKAVALPELPTIPMTQLAVAPPRVQSRLAPGVAAGVLDPYGALSDLLKQSAVLDETDRDALHKRWQEWWSQEVQGGYARLYVQHWANTAPRWMALLPDSVAWQAVGRASERTVHDGFKRFADLLNNALSANFVPAADPDVQEALRLCAAIAALLEEPKFRADAGRILENWQRLGREEPLSRRKSILDSRLDDFVKEHALPLEWDAKNPLVEYWGGLALHAMRLAAEQAQSDHAGMVRQLVGNFARFPLSVWDARDAGLTLDQLNEARSNLEALMFRLPPATIGGGGRVEIPGRPGLSGYLNALREPEIGEEEKNWLVRAIPVLEAIPRRGGRCTVYALPAREQPTPGGRQFAAIWAYARLRQAGHDRDWVYIRGDRASMGTIDCPGEDLRIGLASSLQSVSPQSKPDFLPPEQYIIGPSHWPALAVLHKYEASRGAEGRWTADLKVVERDGRERLLRVELRFDGPVPLPPLEEWPAYGQNPALSRTGGGR